MTMQSTPSPLADVWREVEQVDVPADLEHRSLQLSSGGVTWRDAPRIEDYPKPLVLKLYRDMALTRATDREIVSFTRKGLAFGKHLMCTGNEATAVGAATATRPSDWVSLAIRDLGAWIARGVSLEKLLAVPCGRVAGLTGGWDGSLHMGSLPDRTIGLVSHLGTFIPLSAGLAFAARYQSTDDVALVFSGDGATSTGDFHEGLNIASVMDLPLVILIENNQWAFGTPTRLQYAVPALIMRALAYGKTVEGQLVDGTNVLSVYETVQRAVERARAGDGISIVETMSMRLEGHSIADPFSTYVPAEQLAQWHEKDPIATFRARLLAAGLVTDAEIAETDAGVLEEVKQAGLAAEQSPAATDDDIEARVFVSSSMPFPEQIDPPPDGAHVSYHQAIQDALREEMDRDPNLFIIGEDIGISNGAFKVTDGFSKRYDQIDWADYWKTTKPVRQRRVIDAPIGEAGFCGLALGAVTNGLRAVVEFQYADFASEAFKMIVNYAATQTPRGMGPLPIVFRMPAGWAPNTSIYHSVNPESWFTSTPGLKIVAPATAHDAKGLLKAAIHDDNPVLFLEYKWLYRIRPEKTPEALDLPIPADDYVVPIGKGRLVQTGQDLSVIAYGSQVWRAVEAVAQVEREDGVSIEVIDLRSVLPLDVELITQSVEKTSRAIVTCEAPRTGCFGQTIVGEIIRRSFDSLDAPVQLVAAADTPVPFAPALEAAHLPTVDKLVASIRETLAH
jgi:pyruvate/2-oxoglutarate/acetoin dehydrogenase E1 component/TPP-dependent pyruvate/acetoin dehydrogenase alpha subunit